MKTKQCFFIAALVVFLSVSASGQEAGPEAKIIRYDGVLPIFPASWLGKPTRARATIPDSVKYNADTAAVLKALYKYPSSVLEKELSHIYIVGRLSFNRQFFTGTNSTQDVFIGSDGNTEMEKTFHHEFSSILLRNHPDMLLEMKWKELSPELLSKSSAAAVKAGLFSVNYDPKLLAKGYLSAYSLSNWENDFNMYAENIFAGGNTFWKLADSYPKVLEKARLVIKFYTENAWSGFTENFFRAAAE